MQPDTLSQIKERIVLLDPDAKRELADFLASELQHQSKSGVLPLTDETRSEQIEWLKKNREIYSGRYVALSGNVLVGEGESLRAARQNAEINGFREVFVTYVYSENDVPFGGW